MDENDALVVTSNNPLPIVLTAAEVKARHDLIISVMETVMIKGKHYGTIGNARSPSLFKSGAEKLCETFALAPKFIQEEHTMEAASSYEWSKQAYEYVQGQRQKVVNADGELVQRTGVAIGFYQVVYRCDLYNLAGQFLGSCAGEANSREDRNVESPVWNIINTLIKMAQKRALVGAVLIVTGASDTFTQDVEDYPEMVTRGEPEQQPEQAKPNGKPKADANEVPTVMPFGSKDGSFRKGQPIAEIMDPEGLDQIAGWADKNKQPGLATALRARIDALARLETKINEGIVEGRKAETKADAEAEDANDPGKEEEQQRIIDAQDKKSDDDFTEMFGTPAEAGSSKGEAKA